MTKNRKDIVSGIVLTVMGIFVWVSSSNIKLMNTASYGVDSSFFPHICAAMLVILGILLMVASARETYIMSKSVHAGQDGANLHTEHRKALNTRSLARVTITIVTLILFVLLLKSVGFVLCAIGLQFVLMVTLAPLHRRSPKEIVLYLLISICASVLIYLLFVRAFHLMLPAGILRGIF